MQMARNVCHVHNKCVATRAASRRSPHGSVTAANASQSSSVAAAPQVEQPKKKRKEARAPNKTGDASTRCQSGS
jgi:hypothetical protein